MAQAITNKVKQTSSSNYYCWMICDYTMSGTTLSYTLRYYWEWGCTQLDNAWIKAGNSVIWQNTGRVHDYNASHIAQGHNITIHSGTATITGTQTITFGITKYSGVAQSGSFTVSGGVAPATPTITVSSLTDTSGTFAVAVSDYGDPASAQGRYIEAAILAQNSYGETYRYSKAMNTSSSSITVSNLTYDGGSLTIVPNTTYYYGAYASNTGLSSYTVAGQILMLPAYITNVVVADDGHNNMTISVLHANEGSDDTVYTEYSYDQTNWVAVQDEFHLTINTATTLYLRRENTTGATPVYSVSIVPVTTVKLYGSVNNQAKEIKKLYGSVGGESKRIRKLYGSVNGRSKLIYEDNS